MTLGNWTHDLYDAGAMLYQLSQYFAKKKGEKIEMTKRSLWFNGFEVEHKIRLIKICIERCEILCILSVVHYIIAKSQEQASFKICLRHPSVPSFLGVTTPPKKNPGSAPVKWQYFEPRQLLCEVIG